MSLNIEDIAFEDAVIKIPINAISVKIEAKTYENGKIQTVNAEFGPQEIREAFNTFEETMSGDYPVFGLTSYGKEYVGKLLSEDKT